tara:strand:- start:3053 stop:3298 length:246 start_codon:yes stop_codon:yes gene_type:complete
MVQKHKNHTLEEVSDHMAGGQATSDIDQAARAEFLLRQTKAIEETAKHTKCYTKYMFWSVVILALSALGSFLLAVLKYFSN